MKHWDGALFREEIWGAQSGSSWLGWKHDERRASPVDCLGKPRDHGPEYGQQSDEDNGPKRIEGRDEGNEQAAWQRNRTDDDMAETTEACTVLTEQ